MPCTVSLPRNIYFLLYPYHTTALPFYSPSFPVPSVVCLTNIRSYPVLPLGTWKQLPG